MSRDQVISILKNAANQISFVDLTAEEEIRVETLAQELKEIFDRAAVRKAQAAR